MSYERRSRHVTLKLERAKTHAVDLESSVAGFLQTQPYRVGIKRDEERRLIYFLEDVAEAPDGIPLLAGDAIQNLVSGLDHLAYQLVCRATDDHPPQPRRIYFPIADSEEKYEATKASKLQGASPEMIAAVDDLHPFRGGNDTLWKLHRLNNIEKHRILFTVGSQAAGIHLGQLLSAHVGDAFPAEAVQAMKGMDLLLNPADKGFPLSPGFELYRGAPDEEPNPELQFRFTVVLNEPEVAEGEAVTGLVSGFVQEVERVVGSLSPLLE